MKQIKNERTKQRIAKRRAKKTRERGKQWQKNKYSRWLNKLPELQAEKETRRKIIAWRKAANRNTNKELKATEKIGRLAAAAFKRMRGLLKREAV
jgi:hypothetical protein